MEWHAFVISVILLLVVSDSNARSLEQVCTRSCESNDVRKFFAKNDFEYTFNYQTIVESSFHAAAPDGDRAKLNINADFSIITSSDCNLVLQVNRGVHFDNRRPETQDELDWQRAVTAHPLYFQWENGIVKQVCPAVDDPVWVVNFKKGILSAMQSSAEQTTTGVQELDVSGTCESDYLVQEQGHNNVVIRKTKDYSTCENRNEHLLFSWSMPYEIDSLRQNYIQSHQRCVQTARDVLLSVRCDEEHTFRPFSTEDAGAKTTITQTITFQSQRYLRSYEVEEFPIRKTTLKYENEAETSSLSMQDKTTVAREILTDICINMDGESYDLVSKQFMNLVSAVRELDAESLVELSAHTSTCADHSSALSQMLENTLPFCGTEGCVSFASTLIQQGELDDDLAKRWLVGFGLIKQPTTQMITSVLDIVESNKYPQQSFLSIGSMIHQFCENTEDCMENPDIQTTLEVINQHLGSNCHSTTMESRVKTLLALRAIGNAGRTTSVPTLKRCAVESLNSLEVRIASLEAFRRMSCGVDRSGLLTILENTMEDSELRIAAYRNLMQCPTDALLIKIKALLGREENLQVGSYIWSHLHEISESTDPLKIFFGKMLEAYTFKEFDLDFRKYSRYYEATVFSEKFNSGGSADASIVWSPKSFIPRSVTSNVTVHMFGQAINLVEFGGRLEGAEDYLQSILEPANYERRSNNRISSESRHRTNTRETPSSKLHMSGFMRVFGKELAYYNTEMMAAQESHDTEFWNNVMSKFMSPNGYSYHDDTLIVDSAHTLPTGVGMPLIMSFKGSSSIDIGAKGTIDLGLSSPKYSVNGKFTPRAAITVTGSMIVDSHARKTGIATESVAYTSTSISGSVTFKNGGENFDLELESPFNRNMALTIKNKLLKVVGEHTEGLEASEVADTKVCSEEYLGHRLCYTNTFNDNGDSASGYILPRSGEVEISAFSEKMDATLTKYTVSASKNTIYENEGDMLPKSLFLQLDFDTPGSSVNRKAMVMASYNIPEKQMSMYIQKGEEVSRMQGYIVSTDDSKVMEISANVNGETYSIRTNLERMLGDEEKEASAGVTITTPENVMSADANLMYRPGQSMLASFKMNNILPTPVILKVDLKDLSGTSSKMTFSGDVEMAVQPFINSRLLVDMEVNPDWNNIGFSLNYKVGRNPKETISFYHKRTHVERDDESQWSIDHLLSSTQFAGLNYKVLLNHGFSKSAIASTLDIAFGSRMLEKTNPYQVQFSQEYSDNSNASATALSGQVTCSMPFLNVNKELKGSFVNSDRVLSINAEGKSGDESQYAKFIWGSNGQNSELIHQDVEFEVYGTAIGKWTFTSILDESPKDIYSIKSNLGLGTTDELQFVQSATVINLPANKTVRFDLGKGGVGNEILQISSENVKQGSSYHSKNLIDVSGYESRGLNIYMNALPRGYSTSIEFLKASIVSVGAVYTSSTTDHGRQYSIAVTEHDVEPRTVTFKSGYEYVWNNLLESYVELAHGQTPILSSQVVLKTLESGGKYANVSLMMKEHPSIGFSRGLDFYTSVSATDGNAYSVDLIHHNNNRKVNFHVEGFENGIRGNLDQTYLVDLDPLSFTMEKTSTGGFVKLMDNSDHQTKLDISVEDSVMTAIWFSDMPMFREYAAKNGKIIFRSLNDGFRLDSNSEKKQFDIVYRNRWPKLYQFEMSNAIFDIIPKSLLYKASYKKSVLSVKAKCDSETVDLTVNHASEDKFGLTFYHSCDLMESMYIPTSVEISHVKEDENTLTQSAAVSLGEKSIQLETSITADRRTITFGSNGLKPLPESAILELEGNVADNEFELVGNLALEGTPMKVSLTGFNRLSTASTNFPLVSKTGEAQLKFEVTKNEETIVEATSTMTVTSEMLKHIFSFSQNVADFIPRNIGQEQQLIANDREYGIVQKSINGENTNGFDVRYSTQKLQLSQNMIGLIPEELVATYEFGIEQGNIKVVSGAKNLASMEYSMSQNGFKITVKHGAECEYFPALMESDTTYTAEEISSTYVWGERTGMVKFTNGLPNSANVFVKDSGMPLSVDIGYSLSDTEFQVVTKSSYMENEFNLTLAFDNNQEIRLGLGTFDTAMQLNGQKYSFKTTVDVLSLNEIFFSIAKECSRGSFMMERTLTWNAEDNTITAKVVGTRQSPFLLKVTASHNGFESATVEMTHSQDWESVPKHTVVTGTVTSSDSNYKITFDANTDGQERSAEASLMYNFNETGIHIEAKAVSAFEMIDFQNAGIVLDGALVTGKLNGLLGLQLNGKASEDKLTIVWAEPRQLVYSFHQDFTDIMASSGLIKLEEITGGYKLTLTKNSETMTTTLLISTDEASVSTEYRSPSNHGSFGVAITKSPMSLRITHDLEVLSFMPKRLVVSPSIGENENIAIAIEIDDQNSEVLIKKLKNGGLIEYKFQHNLPLLPVPEDASISYRITPPELYLNWGETEAVFKLHDNGFTLRQNFVDQLPKSMSVIAEREGDLLSSMTNQIDVTVDDYAFNHQLIFNKEQVSLTVTATLKKGETSLIDTNIDTKIAAESGHQLVNFEQSWTEAITNSFGYEVEYLINDLSGSVDVRYGIQEPVNIAISYSVEQENQLDIHVTHNIDEIVEYIPMSADIQGNMLLNGNAMTYTGVITSADMRKEISLIVNNKLENRMFEIAFTHDFEQLESYLPPFNASFDILSNGIDLDASVFYKVNSADRYLIVHASIGENDYLLTVDQKLFEETTSTWRRRSHQSSIPDKAYFRLAKSENEYTSDVVFRMGPKRRYLNVSVANPSVPGRTVWKLKIDQNLNKILPTKLPTSSTFRFVMNDTDVIAAFDLGNAEGKMQITRDDPRYAVTISHTVKKLIKAGVPKYVKLEVDNMQVTETSFHIDSMIHYNDYKLSPTIEVTWDSPSISIVGTQEGFEDIITSEDFFLKASASMESKSVEFTSSHNIDGLKAVGYPKTVVFTASKHCGEKEGNIVDTAFSLVMDNQEISNNFIIQINSLTSIEISTNGVRPKAFGSTELINYVSEISASYTLEEQTSVACQIMYKVTDSNSNIITKEELDVSASYAGKRLTASLTLDVPTLSIDRITASGVLSWNEAIDMNAKWGLGEEETSVEMIVETGDRIHVRVAKDDSNINLLVDTNAEQQLVFGHNIEQLAYVPRELTAAVDTESYTVTIITEIQSVRVSFDLQPDSILASYVVDGEELIKLVGEYSTHPAYQASGTFKFTPLEIDYSGLFKIQFFDSSIGKSELEISLMDNASNKGFYSKVYAYLNDGGIWDTSSGVLVQSNVTNAEFKFDTTVVLHAKPFSCDVDIHYNKYFVVVGLSETSFKISSKLPEQLPVNSFVYSASLEKSGPKIVKTTSVSWNGEQTIAATETVIKNSDTDVVYTYELNQPFFKPNNFKINFNFHEENGWNVMSAGFAEVNGRFFQVLEKWQADTHSFNNILDVTQSYYENGNFTVTGSMTTESPSQYETNWRMTQQGEEVMTFAETWQKSSQDFEYTVSWKQPFTEVIPAGFSGSLSAAYSTGTLDVSSEISHTMESEYIPQQFTTTGKMTSSPYEYESNWNIVSGGKTIVVFNKGYSVSLENGISAHLTWKQPFAPMFTPNIEYTFQGQLVKGGVKGNSELEYTGDEGQVTITQGGIISYSENGMASQYTITRNGQEIYFMDSSVKRTPYFSRAQFGWRQSVSETLMANFNGSVDIHTAEGSVAVTSHISHSAERSSLPPQFTVTSHVTYTESSFAFDEKVTIPSGATLQSSDFSIKETKVGREIDLNIASTPFNLNGNVVLDGSLDADVTISHTFECKYFPKSFVTTGKISYGEWMYDSDWKISSGEQELVRLIKKFELIGGGLSFVFDWRQPYEEFVVKSLLISSDVKNEDDHVSLVNIVKYNDVNTWNVTYDRVSDDVSRRYIWVYSENGQEFRYMSQFSQNVVSTKVINEINVPEVFSRAYNIPSSNRLEIATTKNSKRTEVTTTVTSSALDNPRVATVSWTLHDGSVLFNGYLGLKQSPTDLPGMDAELGITVDLKKGITITYKVPQIGLDHEITVKYNQETAQITIEYIANHGRPIVFTINLGRVAPTIKQVYNTLKKKHVLPKMKPIAYYSNDENGFELVVGVKVRDTPYTLHIMVGPDSQQPSFKIITKRRNVVVDEVLSVTAELIDMENVQVVINVNKGLDKYLTNALGSSVAEMKDKVTVIADSMIEVLRSLDNFVEGSDVVQGAIDAKRNALIERITEVKGTILDFLTSMHTDSINFMQGTEESSRSGLFMLFNAANVGVKRLLTVVSKPWLDLKKSMLEEVSNQMYAEIEPMLQSIVAMLNKVHAGQLFLELVEEGVNKFVFGMDKNMEALLRAAEAPLAKFMTITENKIVLTIPLSFKLREALSPPSWSDIEMWITQSAFADEVRRNLKVLDDALRFYNRIKAILNMPFDEIFPPFKGHAEISGFRHIRTFDGKRYSYRSACSSKHLLVHDTKYNEFSVHVAFETVPVISITTIHPTEGEQTINIKADYSVTDERNRDIVVPNEYNNVLIKRTGDLISVTSEYGVAVTCNFISELCTVDISPFYFGQVNGMLGTFNNEPSDDFTSKGDVVIRNSEELAQSWMVSQSGICAGDNTVQRCDLVSNEQCSMLFENENSPFAPCFALEDPRPYQLMCSKDTCSSVSSENGVCRAFASYSRRCALRGVFIPVPSNCNKCNAVSGEPFNVDMEVPVTGADVIFVVQRAQCLRFKKKDYKKLVAGVHSALRGSQARGSINYAVVGFGGPDGLAEPHTVTFGNQIYVESTSGRLSNEDERQIYTALKVGAKSQSEADILEGIRYASQVPMRAGAARSIILITCDDCSTESKVPLDTVRQLLIDQGIVLHHLRQKTIKAGRTSKKVYGFNQNGIFSKSATLPRSELKASNLDQCQQLTDLTSGSIWNSNLLGRDAWELVGGEVRRGVDAVPSQSCTCSATDFGSTTAKCTDSRARR